MTQDEQMQVQAAINFLRKQLDNALTDGMNAASKCEELAQIIKARDEAAKVKEAE